MFSYFLAFFVFPSGGVAVPFVANFAAPSIRRSVLF
jgi:hypothetical protein